MRFLKSVGVDLFNRFVSDSKRGGRQVFGAADRVDWESWLRVARDNLRKMPFDREINESILELGESVRANRTLIDVNQLPRNIAVYEQDYAVPAAFRPLVSYWKPEISTLVYLSAEYRPGFASPCSLISYYGKSNLESPDEMAANLAFRLSGSPPKPIRWRDKLYDAVGVCRPVNIVHAQSSTYFDRIGWMVLPEVDDTDRSFRLTFPKRYSRPWGTRMRVMNSGVVADIRWGEFPGIAVK